MRSIKIKKRTFGGKINNFEDNEERKLQKKHLKAYLRGHKRFFHGYNLDGTRKIYLVQENWIKN